MPEAKDTAIKLFGKTIPFHEIAAGSRNESSRTTSDVPEKCSGTENSSLENGDGEEREVNKDTFEGEITKATQKGVSPQTSELCAAQDSMTETNGNPKTPSIDTETTKLKPSRNEEDNQSDTTSGSEEKTLKKPDKIIPCPRCNSMDTKFCYYNNYNVNQPRHFCKNCQRYWTAGGTMRNVAVGAGRRKNKNSTSHFPHITIPETLQIPQNDVSNIVHHPSVNPNGMVSYIAEKTMQDCKNEEEIRTCHTVFPQVTCFPGAPWTAYPWISAQWNPSGYPMPLYWGGAVPGNWNIPDYPFASSGQNSCLGKHLRDDDDQIKPIDSERCLWTPKTLRIDDPGEAAKSSIWETLGIKNEMVGSIGGRGLFKAFQSKGDGKNHVVKSSPSLQANPAALCRSVNFHESS